MIYKHIFKQASFVGTQLNGFKYFYLKQIIVSNTNYLFTYNNSIKHFIHLHTVKWFQVLLSNNSISVYS